MSTTTRGPKTPPTFRFTAVEKDRKMISGTVVAPNRKAAQDQLQLRFAHLITLEEIAVSDWTQVFRNLGQSSEALPVYTKAISVMLDAGLPLAQIFEVSAKGEDRFLNDVMRDVGQSLRDGRSLSASLERWKSVFDYSFLGMCRAAEKSGRLHITFKRLAELIEKRWILKKKLKAAFTYPVLISTVALAIFWILVIFVVPALIPSFTSIGVQLPWPTRVLVWVGNLSTSGPVVLGVFAAFVASALAFHQIVLKGHSFPTVQLLWDRMLLDLPLFGKLYKLAIFSRTLATMSALMESGLPMTEVLASAGQVSGSAVYRRHFDKVLLHLKEGAALSDALSFTAAFPPLMEGVCQLGEESGKMPFLFRKVAELYEEDLEMEIQTLTTLLEPILLGFMGIIIGFIVLGTFMPMVNLVQQL